MNLEGPVFVTQNLSSGLWSSS